MGHGIYAALSGAVAQSIAMETTATNLANASTAGYRSIRPVFHEVLERTSARQNVRYSAIASTIIDPKLGAVKQTGRNLDIALPSGAFLAVSSPAGELYTRAGSLKIDPSGALKTSSGDEVLSEGGGPISVDTQYPVTIMPSGEVSQNGDVVGRLRTVTFDRPEAMEHVGNTLLRPRAEAGASTPSTEPILVGSVEESNSTPVQGMTELLTASRMFEAFQRAIEAFQNADRKVVNQVPAA